MTGPKHEAGIGAQAPEELTQEEIDIVSRARQPVIEELQRMQADESIPRQYLSEMKNRADNYGETALRQHKEAKSGMNFLKIGSTDVERRYAEEYKYKEPVLESDLARILSEFAEKNGGNIPEQFFSSAVKIAERYKELGLDYSQMRNDAEATLLFAQLKSMLGNPAFMKNMGCVPVIETLADLSYHEANPCYTEFCYFKKGENGKQGEYKLKDGFGLDQLPVFQQLVDNEKLWKSKSDGVERLFLSAIANALQMMAKNNPEETLPLRLSMLRHNADNRNHAEIKSKLVNTFKSDTDRAALQKIVEEEPESATGQEAKKILSGGYDNVLWAI